MNFTWRIKYEHQEDLKPTIRHMQKKTSTKEKKKIASISTVHTAP